MNNDTLMQIFFGLQFSALVFANLIVILLVILIVILIQVAYKISDKAVDLMDSVKETTDKIGGFSASIIDVIEPFTRPKRVNLWSLISRFFKK